MIAIMLVIDVDIGIIWYNDSYMLHTDPEVSQAQNSVNTSEF